MCYSIFSFLRNLHTVNNHYFSPKDYLLESTIVLRLLVADIIF